MAYLETGLQYIYKMVNDVGGGWRDNMQGWW